MGKREKAKKMVAALYVWDVDGEGYTTEAGEGRCAVGEEVGLMEVEVQRGTVCDLCGEEIK